MALIPDNVRQDLITFVPAAMINDISCFVFYDNHPRDGKEIDVIICTCHGELQEYFHREMGCSILIEGCRNPTEVRILRNSKCDLFYIVAFEDKIVVLMRRSELQILHRINNVDRYEVEDTLCSGQASLKIICKDDAVPLTFDDNFESLRDREILIKATVADDTQQIMTQLARKLTETVYTVKCNEKAYNDLVCLRQIASDEPLKRGSCPSGPEGPLKIINKQPFVLKICNMKVVMVLELMNDGSETLEDVHFLLHDTSQPATTYTTKLFQSSSKPPFWEENDSNIINPNSTISIALIIDVKELKFNTTGKVNLNGDICYKVNSEEYFLLATKVIVSAKDIMGGYFDLVLQPKMDPKNFNIVALLSATERIDLALRVISKEKVQDLKIFELLCKHLKMEQLFGNMVHMNSPYHILHGVLVYEKENIGNNRWIISLHTRSPQQILAFIHYIHDAVPYRVLITTPEQKITAKTSELVTYNEGTFDIEKRHDYTRYGHSIIKQTSLTLEYFDECMCKMSGIKNAAVQSKIGREIDIFAGGKESFLEFRNNVLKEIEVGVQNICEVDAPVLQSEDMLLDSD